MKVRAFDYRRADRNYRDEIDAAVERVIESGQLVLGPEVEAFEAEFAAWTGADHAVGTASGTDSLILALRALGVGPGSEVVTVSLTAVPTVAAIRAVGARARFVDVRDDTLCMDPERLESALGPDTRCVVPVHLHGRSAEIGAIGEIAARRGVPVLEDCAQAHGARPGGRHVGTFGRIGAFSFYPTKNLGAYGDAGACVTGDPELADRMRMLGMYGFRNDGVAHIEGSNSRLDELQAAILRVKLAHLDQALAERRSLVARYRGLLADTELVLPAEDPDDGACAWHLFAVRTPDRERVVARLNEAGIGFGIHYPVPVHTMPAYASPDLRPGDLPVTERACGELLSLPLYPGLEDREIEAVAAVFRRT